MPRGFAAEYLRLRRTNCHRLEDKSIHLPPDVDEARWL